MSWGAVATALWRADVISAEQARELVGALEREFEKGRGACRYSTTTEPGSAVSPGGVVPRVIPADAVL